MKNITLFLMIISLILVQCKKENDTIEVKDRLNLKVELAEKKHAVLSWDETDIEGFEKYYIEKTEISDEDFFCSDRPEFSNMTDFESCYRNARSKVITIYDRSQTTYIDSTYSYQANIYYSVRAFGKNDLITSKAIKLVTPELPSVKGELSKIRIDSSGHYLFIVNDNLHIIQIDLESNKITREMDCDYNLRNLSVWNHNNQAEICLIYENYLEIRDAATFSLLERIELDISVSDVAYYNEKYLIGFSSQYLNLFSIDRGNKSVKDYGRVSLAASDFKNLNIVDSSIYVFFRERGLVFNMDANGNLTNIMDKELDYAYQSGFISYLYNGNNKTFYNTAGYLLDIDLSIISSDKYVYSASASCFDKDNLRIYYVTPGTKQLVCKNFDDNTYIPAENRYTFSFPTYLVCQNNMIISVGINAMDSFVPHTYFVEIFR